MVAGLAVLLLGTASVTAIADGDESNHPGDGHPQVESIEASATATMAVLRSPRTSGDGLPAHLSGRMDEHSPFGMNPDLSRLSIGNVANSVYVVPAHGHVCVVLTMDGGADLSCPSTDDIVDGRVAPTTVILGTGGIAIYGLVPDGVEEVAVRTGEADSLDVATQGNAYYTVVPPGTPLRSVAYVGPSGSVEFPIVDPSAVFEEQ